MEYIAEITHIKKQIDDFHLGPIDLRVEPGTITAIVGNNGSGKSTLLKLIMNLVNPDLGNVKLFGTLVYGEDESWKKHIAYQPQTVIGWDAFNGKTLKDFIASLYPDWDEDLFHNMVSTFQIPLNKKFNKLSQGMQQKLNLALTIPRNAPLLILDEPTSFMDIPSKKHLIDILVHWMDQGDRSIIFSSHQMEDIKKLSDYLFVLHNGNMIGNYEKDALLEKYKSYWIQNTTPLPNHTIPGEISRTDQQLISNQADRTEAFLMDEGMQWTKRTSLDLEDIVSLLLKPIETTNDEVT
ncbi:ABC-2 type transport system ATP-binding protein [Oceanobacillus limi]|uniref:ABC-2 type transport system ATP-binding protein n=1 Tax=Oceanobacillus limi TaxID=930131 RepID=A0A1I0F0B4_9BACI|nr:ABC transporter ATP-binding protein [Oceanobacillus limi]SET50822.1 ABC-2 type transport system ATP-binding protein [Oceanobacillus limi]